MIDRLLMDNIADNFAFHDLYKTLTKYVEEQLEQKITEDTLKDIQAFYLTGCGDSLFEAYAVQNIFEKYTGIPTEVIESLEFTKYRAGFIRKKAAVFCISNSGGASRTVESVKVANTIGALSIAVSGSDKSPLSENAQLLIHRPVPQFTGVMGNCGRVVRNMAEYVISIHVLNMIALHIARIYGNITEEKQKELLSQMLSLPEKIYRTAKDTSEPLCHFIEEHQDEKAMFFLGAGPNYATALFGCAKLHEDVPVNGIAEWLEEWAHLQYFLSLNEEKKTPVAIISAPGKARNRAEEIAASASGMQVPVLEIRSCADNRRILPGTTVLQVYDEEIDEGFSPAVYCVPLQLLGIYWALAKGLESVPLMRGDEYQLIRGSKIEINYME